MDSSICIPSDRHQKIGQSTTPSSRSRKPTTKELSSLRVVVSLIPRSVGLPGADVEAYKVVDLVIHQPTPQEIRYLEGGATPKLTVLLTLNLPFRLSSVYRVMGEPGICAVGQLDSQSKYATDHAQVVGFRFLKREQFGAFETEHERQFRLHRGTCVMGVFLRAMMEKRAHLQSKYDPTFIYPAGGSVTESAAGQGCGQGRCGQGIYFWLDSSRAIDYFDAMESLLCFGTCFSTPIRPLILGSQLIKDVDNDTFIDLHCDADSLGPLPNTGGDGVFGNKQKKKSSRKRVIKQQRVKRARELSDWFRRCCLHEILRPETPPSLSLGVPFPPLHPPLSPPPFQLLPVEVSLDCLASPS